MKKIWVNKASSYDEAKDFDEKYYKNMSPQERLETVQFLRNTFFTLRGINARRKRLRRNIKILQQT